MGSITACRTRIVVPWCGEGVVRSVIGADKIPAMPIINVTVSIVIDSVRRLVMVRSIETCLARVSPDVCSKIRVVPGYSAVDDGNDDG